LLQVNIPDKYRGRVAGALNAITSLALLLGMLITSMLGDRIGSVTLLATGSCLNVLNGVVTFMMLWNVKLRLDHLK